MTYVAQGTVPWGVQSKLGAQGRCPKESVPGNVNSICEDPER